jgi:hypothetical protein
MPAFIPVLMFAVLIGLSMDYEVFLVSRMRESCCGRTATGTGRSWTAPRGYGPGYQGGCSDHGRRVCRLHPEPGVVLKIISVGMAAAIAIDATVVRLLLVWGHAPARPGEPVAAQFRRPAAAPAAGSRAGQSNSSRDGDRYRGPGQRPPEPAGATA